MTTLPGQCGAAFMRRVSRIRNPLLSWPILVRISLVMRSSKCVQHPLCGATHGSRGDRTAELETLVVAQKQRSKGIGALLLDRVESELDRLGIKDVIVGAIPTNTEALEMYRRRGFAPTVLLMSRFACRRKTEGLPNPRLSVHPRDEIQEK